MGKRTECSECDSGERAPITAFGARRPARTGCRASLPFCGRARTSRPPSSSERRDDPRGYPELTRSRRRSSDFSWCGWKQREYSVHTSMGFPFLKYHFKNFQCSAKLGDILQIRGKAFSILSASEKRGAKIHPRGLNRRTAVTVYPVRVSKTLLIP